MSDVSLNFTMTPVFDVASFNTILTNVKQSLGEIGKDIHPIDEVAFRSAMDSIRSEASKPITVPPVDIPKSKVPAPDISEIPKTGEKAGKDFAQGFSGGVNDLKGSITSVTGMLAGAFAAHEILSVGSDFIDAGKKTIESSESMKLAFAQAGIATDELDSKVKANSNNLIALADKYALPINALRQYSQQAAMIGGATGQMNSDITTLTKYKLKFPLLSDPDKKVMEAYGAFGEKTMYGKKTVGVIRSTFLIDEAGKVQRAWYNVRADGHAEKVLDVVRSS